MYHVLFTRHYSLGPGSALSEKGQKIGVGKKKTVSEASREVVWGGERVAEPGDVPLMPLSQRFGHPRVLGIPIPISLAFWASPVGDAQNADHFDFA